MLALFSAIFGFFAPFLPEVLKYFRAAQDNKHELALLELRMKQSEKEFLWKMEEIDARADIEEAKILRAPQQSFGVQILDAAAKSDWSQWTVVPVFWLFALLDFISGLVRPGITYIAFGGYLFYKKALFDYYISVGATLKTTPLINGTIAGVDLSVIPKEVAFKTNDAMILVWGEQDYAILTLVLCFYFGGRFSKAAFGGNASHGGVGK